METNKRNKMDFQLPYFTPSFYQYSFDSYCLMALSFGYSIVYTMYSYTFRHNEYQNQKGGPKNGPLSQSAILKGGGTHSAM